MKESGSVQIITDPEPGRDPEPESLLETYRKVPYNDLSVIMFQRLFNLPVEKARKQLGSFGLQVR
jgi:hypothetical protein